MFEIRFHARGGQGAKTAAQMLAEITIENGKYAQAFPEFGPERTGAPMQVFARVSDKEIRVHEPIVSPDIVIVVDSTLLNNNILEGLKENGILIINSEKKQNLSFKGKTYNIDATGISIKYLGSNKPNTPLLGALAKVSDIITLNDLNKKIEKTFLRKLGEQKTQANIQAAKEAYEKVI